MDRLPLAHRVAQLNDRVPERDLRVDDLPGRICEPFLFPGAEGLFQEIDQFAASLTISTGVMVWYPSGIGFTWLGMRLPCGQGIGEANERLRPGEVKVPGRPSS